MEIRAAHIDDVPLLLAMIRELAEYERLSHEVVATEQLLREHLFGPNPAAHTIIVSVDGEPCGYAMWFQRYSTFTGRRGFYLEDIYVRPQYRQRGIGKALLREIARQAVGAGCDHVQWAALRWNQKAIEFYRKIGARPMDEWITFHLGSEALQQLARG